MYRTIHPHARHLPLHTVRHRLISHSISTSPSPPLISITSSTFYAHHPSTPLPASLNPPLFPNLNFTLYKHTPWCVLAPSPSKSVFLSLLRGSLISVPPDSRTYPYFSQRNLSPFNASGIALVQFGGGEGGKGLLGGGVDGGGYISARYESFRAAEDVHLRRWLITGGEMNIFQEGEGEAREKRVKEQEEEERLLNGVVEKLNLSRLLDQPVMTLSNGQARRAKLARALLKKPEVLLIDEPFMGLDPPSQVGLSRLLKELALGSSSRSSAPSAPSSSSAQEKQSLITISTTPLLALRTQDPVPSWVENIAVLSEDHKVLSIGKKEQVVEELKEKHGLKINTTEEPGQFKDGILGKVWSGISSASSTSFTEPSNTNTNTTATTDQHWDSKNNQEILIDLSSINITYNQSSDAAPTSTSETTSSSPRTLLTSFSWRLRRSDKYAVLGPNGSGKTTLLSLLTSDHPQTYSQNITFFNHPTPRNTPPLQPLFEIQKRIGVASPEVLAFFPREHDSGKMSIHKAVISAWAENPVMKPEGVPQDVDIRVKRILGYFKDVLPTKSKNSSSTSSSSSPSQSSNAPEPDETFSFYSLTPSQQRLIIFIRAVIKHPDLLILDEAFSGMDGPTRKLALKWVEENLSPRQALVVVSHVEEEIPNCVDRWVRLSGVEGGGKAVFGVA